MDARALEKHLAARETAKAEDLMREAVIDAGTRFRELYRQD